MKSFSYSTQSIYSFISLEIKKVPLLLILLPLSLFSGKVYSQIIPPGGIGNSSNIIMWLSPDTALYNNSGNVALNGEDILEWHDLSSNHFIFTNTNTARRPVLTTYNGQNFLDFTPGDFLENTIIKNVINGLNEFSIFVVVKSDVTNTDNGFLDSENPDDADDKICLRYDKDGANNGGTNVIKAGLQGNTPNNQIETTNNVQTTNIQVITITWKSGEKLKSYINGVANELSPNTVTGPISNISKILLGKGVKDGASGAGWDGRIGTVIFYNHQFPADTIATISNSAFFTAGTIGSNQTICSGAAPAVLTNTSSPTGGNGSYTYQWQSSSDNVVWTTIGGATSSTYSPGTLTSSTYYRRRVTSENTTRSSSSVLITVNPNLPASVSISSTATAFCSGSSVTFTATPVNGGGSPSYQWKRNGTNVGMNNAGYTTTTLSDGDVVKVVMTSNATCVTGSPATSNSIMVTVISGGGSWSGITSNNWNTNSNWCSGSRPTAATNVTVNGGTFNDPLISTSNAVCNNLTLNSGATLTVNGRNLTVSGTLDINSGATLVISSNIVTVNGNITINSGGTLIINSPGVLQAKRNIINNGSISGTGTILLNGTVVQNINGSGANTSNLTLDNAAGCNVNSSVTLSGNLTLTNGQLRTNNNLTIDLNTGSIAGTGSGTIFGDVTFYKTVNSNAYHYMSSPLSGLTVNEWNDDVQIKFGQYKNLYTYNENYTDTSKAVGWDPVTSLGTSLVSMKGYALYFDGPVTMDVTGTYTHNATFSDASLTNTISGNTGSDGWNLVGNPYPSTLDWDATSGWTKTNLDGAIYFWDPINNRHASYVSGAGTNGGVPYIPSMQAFWVKVNAAGGTGTLSMDNSVRITTPNPSVWRMAGTGNMLRLTASSGGYSDETVVRFRGDAEETFDSHADAYKKSNSGNTPSIYTAIGGVNYSINSLPDSLMEKIVPVKLNAGFTGIYTISAEEIGSFGSEYSIILEDRILEKSQDLRSNPSYVCSVTAGDTTGRFYLNFRKSAINSNTPSSGSAASMLIRGSQQTVYLKFNNTNSESATISISDLLGQNQYFIENATISSGEYSIVFPSVKAGIYIVKVVTPEISTSEKVYLNQ